MNQSGVSLSANGGPSPTPLPPRENADAAIARLRDNRSHAASEGRDRGSDLAVTARELNAGAGVGRLGAFQETDDGRETSDHGDR